MVPEIASVIKKAQDMFGEFEVMVGDYGGLGKTIMETLAGHYGLNVIPAEKKEKFDHIELLNSDLLSKKAMILHNSGLMQEMETLQWDHTGLKEHHSCENHCCDAFLYLWRHSYHYLREKIKEKVVFGTRQYWKDKDEEDFQKAVRDKQTESSKGVDDNDYGFYSELYD